MLFGKPGQPTGIKHIVYLTAATVLGLLLALVAHALIEMDYLARAILNGRTVTFYGGCALAPWLQATLPVIGAAGGFLLGRIWWRYLYVDRIWEKKIKK
jgi:hypothetical protein